MRILLIEDNADDICLLQDMLLKQTTENSVTLDRADRLSVGRTMLVHGETDVVLVDLSLPDSQGLDALEHIQTQAPDLPVIVLTDLDDDVTAMQALRKGAQDYL